MKVKYIKHPVSPEEKEKIRSQGFKIIDAKFAPEGEKTTGKRAPKKPEPEKSEQKPDASSQDKSED